MHMNLGDRRDPDRYDNVKHKMNARTNTNVNNVKHKMNARTSKALTIKVMHFEATGMALLHGWYAYANILEQLVTKYP